MARRYKVCRFHGRLFFVEDQEDLFRSWMRAPLMNRREAWMLARAMNKEVRRG